MTQRLSEVVIGIDFGTTFSGVSWAVNGGEKKIQLINNWPDPKAKALSPPKVPSVINYVDGKPQKWGYEVTAKDEQLRWIKLLLHEDSSYASQSDQVKESTALLSRYKLSAQDVVRDYLRELWQFVLREIRDVREDFSTDSFDIRVILTVPAIWNDAAKEKTKQAALAAGIPDNIVLLSEPEAAAHVTLRDKADDDLLQVGDVFIVCDAGGGTVDLISYKILGLKPLSIEESAIGDGGMCGSVSLNMAFQNHIVTLLGHEQWSKVLDKHKRAMMEEFEHGIKRTFTEEEKYEYTVELRGIEDDPNNGISDETISISKSSLRAIFNTNALQIDNLIDKQIKSVKGKGMDVKAILLVGGFGASKFLLRHLQTSHQHQDINVYQVRDAWASICRGATLWGLEHSQRNKKSRFKRKGFGNKSTSSLADESGRMSDVSTVVSRMARYSYGSTYSAPFDANLHLEEDKFYDADEGIYRAGNQMEWHVRRGDKIHSGNTIKHEFYKTVNSVGMWSLGARKFNTVLFYCSDDIPPLRRTASIRKLCEVNYEIDSNKIKVHERTKKNSIDGTTYRQLNFELLIILKNTSLDFGVQYKGDVLGSVNADYDAPDEQGPDYSAPDEQLLACAQRKPS